MEFVLTTSNKGRPCIVLNGYKFTFKRTMKNNLSSWYCTNKMCSCSIETDSKNENIVNVKGTHNHPGLPNHSVERHILRNACKRIAKEQSQPLSKPSKLMKKEFLSKNYTLNQSDKKSIQEAVYRVKRLKYGKLPQNRADLQANIASFNLQTIRKESFLVLNDTKYEIIGLSCDTNLQKLSDFEYFIGDTTQNYCPKHFEQLFILHGYVNGHYVPLVYFILPKNTLENYVRVLECLKDIAKQYGQNFQPNNLIIEFERNAIDACKAVFPKSIIKCCRFNLTRKIYWKIFEFDLVSSYRYDKVVSNWLINFFGLAFVEPNEVDFVFQTMIQTKPTDDKRLNRFINYVSDNFAGPNAKFPSYLWAEEPGSFVPRASNCAQLYQLEKGASLTPNPHIWNFIDVVMNIQNKSYGVLDNLDKPATEDSDEKIKWQFAVNCRIQYKQGFMTIMDYIQTICHHFRVNY